jgi:GNAT superfamily N-acetyltransferase
MADEYRIAIDPNPDEAAAGIVGRGLRAFNEAHAGEGRYQRLGVFLSAPDGEVAGGLVGATSWDWFYIELLWLPEGLRGRGFGRRLLALAENEARGRGAHHAFLDTFSFQAPDFYTRQGYEIFGELPDFPPGHRRYYLWKRL